MAKLVPHKWTAVAVGLIIYAATLAVSLLGAPAFAVGSRRAVSV